MKANDFFKKVGIDAARSYVAAYEDALTDDLKRLVESHDLIASRGGLDAAKHELITLQKHLNNTFGWVTIITSEKIDRLKQAILDVESCHVD